MKRFFISFFAIIATISSTLNLKADDHADQSYFNFQVNFYFFQGLYPFSFGLPQA